MMRTIGFATVFSALSAQLLVAQPVNADSLKFTAVQVMGKVVYFNTVDESKVPGLTGSIVDSMQEQSKGGLSIPVAFDAQREPYRSGVERPDMGIGVGPKYIVQSINAQIAVFTTSGQKLKGWPKSANLFLGLKATDFVVDTRAQWDTWDHRFWISFLCPHGYCLAVSKTSDPTGVWYVYGFDLLDKPGFEVDFGMFAFDQHTVSVSTHMAHYRHQGQGLHAGIFTIDKAALESGSTNVAPQGFADIHTSGHDIDTVEPVLVPNTAGGQPAGEFFMSTEGFNFPCYGIRPYCTHLYVFMLSGSGNSQSISGGDVEMQPYRFTPVANTPKCKRCLETVGPMMTTSPVYNKGLISFAFGTGVNNGSQEIAAIRWGQLAPTVTGMQLTSTRLIQSGTLEYPGDRAAFFPSVMTDYAGSFYMVFDVSSSTQSPSVYVAARRASDPFNQLTEVQLVKGGAAPPDVFPWGDYTAGAFSGSSGPVWFASEYAGVNNEFGTEIFNVNF
jgi:hypothetical protein